MKTTKLVTLGLIGLSVAALAAPTAQAATKDATSKATVKFNTEWPVFTPNSTEAAPVEIEFPNSVVDGKVEGSTLPVEDGKADLTARDFDIIYVTDFDFRTQTYNGKELKVFASAPTFTAVDSAKQTAADNAPLGFSIGSLGNTPDWSLTAKMTPFYQDGEKTKPSITGTKVTLHNVKANNVLDATNDATPFDETDLVLEGDNSPTEENVTTTKIGSFSNGTGMAINNFAFGSVAKDAKETDQDICNGVELTIPQGANVDNKTYIADITWTIANTAF